MEVVDRDTFTEYIRKLPSEKKELGLNWAMAIGLQDVDGLKTSDYLYELATRNIEGELSFDEVEELLDDYHSKIEERDK